MAISGRTAVYILLSLLLLTGGDYYFWQQRNPASVQEKYKIEAAARSNVVQGLTANGTLNPVEMVNVGTQVSGAILKLHADFNPRVMAGQVLAELGPALFDAQLKQSEANPTRTAHISRTPAPPACPP